MSDLFDNGPAASPAMPLAEAMRPKSIDEVVGQSHLLGPGKPLQLLFDSGRPYSLILWGPPGIGKTTLSRLMATAFDAEFIALSAVFSGVKEIREAIAQAEANLKARGRHTILFIDEVHRFNKAQQDAFLPYVEQGLITFIGATTENPSFEVNGALLSRARVYVLKPLTDDELDILFDRAQRLHIPDRRFSPQAKGLLIAHADGDARKLINLIEQTATAASVAGLIEIDESFAAETLSTAVRRFDKGGDAFYDLISALHKSVRGSDPDAAVYWFCRMVDGGADPLYVGRRLVKMAWEDIGLADPRAMTMALDAVATFERLGSPEGEQALAAAAIYLACAPKSNASYTAYNKAKALVAADRSRPVPVHLRNAPTKLMSELGYGAEYRYPHDEPNPYAYAAGENYFPEGLKETAFYQPVERGLEIRIGERLAFLKELDRKAGKKR